MRSSQATFLGHPRGLATLFMTEFFERFTYYGLRAMLVLFLVAATTTDNAGFGMSPEAAGAIYGLYTGAVYLFALPGGWIADRLIGARRAVFWGGVLIMLGNFVLAIPAGHGLFYLGLLVIALGVGLLKPNISVLVGALYEDQPAARRDAGFSIFYMGINLGAFIAPFIAGTIGEAWNWRGGFFCAGLAMGIGLVQYRLTEHFLGEAGLRAHPSGAAEVSRGWRYVWIAMVILAATVFALFAGIVEFEVTPLARVTGVVISVCAIAFFASVLIFADLTSAERGRIIVIAVFFLCSALFWGGFEQAATTFNLFAQDFTDRSLFGSWFPAGVHPATWYQAANPIFVVLLAPVFAWIWVALGRRNLDPSAPLKFGFGLVLLAVGFVVMMLAAQVVIASGEGAAPTWLLITHLVHTTGELCLSPVGLSNVTRLSPPRFVGQMMGTWFLGVSLGNLIAGLVGGYVSASGLNEMPGQFLIMTSFIGAAGMVMIVAAPGLKKLAGDA